MSETQQIAKLGMPKWGLSMTEGTVVQWLVEEGADLSSGDEVVEVESEKINNAVETPASGVLRRRVAKEGEVLPVGGLLGVIAPADVPDSEVDAFVEEFQETFDPAEAAEAGGPEPETVEVGGRRIQYLRMGEGGVPLVLIPGFGGDINIFVFNQEALSEDRAVYALDMPGHGGSEKDVGEGDLDFFVGVVEGFLDEMGVEKAHLAGHSMGGAIAGAFALAHPERVTSLVLLASAGLGEEINADYIEGFIAANRRKEMKNVLQLLFADPDLVTRQLVNDQLQYKRKDGVDEALRAVADKMFPDGKQAGVSDLSGTEVPILAVWGREDAIVPAKHSENLPEHAKVEILEGKGHMVQMEAAGPTNRLIQGFLAGSA
ncbi:acetoin dehydrogenase dihydrolipoyllysine-residue acetyltransferase subunit [Rubrobacter tropicus]|uniref:Acetoin dehydrogenase dihydrolipoyllysine-residue acetyltransferase subunit n=1 Tax=Rubrobacter tropicus TaxID=2653851 RepID=A0A6G8Q655_9ACTN|nr:acetoin dehydrogenase dihydrolipoyllysine-residue acetyltransferase subunit [Rubrobacter tropicus]QIN81974.1 acetoin dehydrogenase dihydrolipoyllysine-residue acetyltransferase subunit [Rubrobacter tropicus]